MATRPLTQSRSLAAALNAQALGALWSPVAFGTVIPLDGVKVMPPQTVSGALAFGAAAAPQPGGTCYLRLTADGTHAPSFPGFTEHGSSSGFDTTAGTINLVTFWHDGTSAFYAVAQAIPPAAPAVVATAVIPNADPTRIIVGFSVSLDASNVPAASAFAIADGGGADVVTAVAITDGQLVLTKSRTTLAADTVHLSYARPATAPLTDINGNAVANFADRQVTNQVSGSNWLRFTTGAHLTETPDGLGGYDYTADATVTSIYSAGAWGYSAKRLAAGADGAFQLQSNGNAPYVGFATGSAPQDFSQTQYGIYVNGGIYNSNGMSPVTPAAYASGDLIRIRRAGTTLYGEVSKDGGTSWIVVAQAAGVSTGVLTPFVQASAAGAFLAPVGTASFA